jgi:hypothetical protein
MDSYNFCLAWNWEYDHDFVEILAEACRSNGVSLLQVTPGNLSEVMEALAQGRLRFQAFMDRASDQEAGFIPLADWASMHSGYYFNCYDKACSTRNKAVMHYSLIDAGLQTPFTIILPSFQDQPDFSAIELHRLGQPFVITPPHAAPGKGVMIDASHLNQVLDVRQEYPADQYLLQANIAPRELGSHRAWFRVIYCTGEVYPCWWDQRTHLYTPVCTEDERQYELSPLREAAGTIARLTGLDIFSTEIAFTTEGLFIVVDYVNDMIDLRLQSKAADGIPDEMVRDIARRLVGRVIAVSR